MSVAHETEVATLDKWIDDARRGLFGLGIIMLKNPPHSTWSYLLLTFLNFFQMASFALNNSHRLPWAGTPVEPLTIALGFASTGRLDVVADGNTFSVVLAIAASWVGIFVLLSLHVARNFLTERPQNETELRVLRAFALLSTTTLFIPFTSVLFRGIACPGGEEWYMSGWKCTSGSRIAVAILLGVVLVFFACLSLFVAAVFIDRNPSSLSWAARSHGRVTVILLCQKLILTFLFNVLGDSLIGGAFLTIVVIASGAVWLFLTLRMMPMTVAWVNNLEAALAAAYTWLGVCLALAQLVSGTQMWILVYLSAPFVGVLGAFCSHLIKEHIASQGLEDCRTVHEANVWARTRMQFYAKLTADRSSLFVSHKHAYAVDGGRSMSSSGPRAPRARRESGGLERLATWATTAAQSVMRRVASSRVAVDQGRGRRGSAEVMGGHVMIAGKGGEGREDGDEMDANSAVEPTEAEQLQGVALRDAERGYRYMMEAFGDELSCVLTAAFYERHCEYHFEEASALARSLTSNPALDTRFQVFRRSRDLSEARGEHGSGLSPIDRIIFDQKKRLVSQRRIDAYRTMQAIWEVLTEPIPSLDRLDSHAQSLYSTMESIDKLYSDLLRINASSPDVLRGYASYLMDLKNDEQRAQELLNKADRIEESHNRSRSRRLKHVNLGESKVSHIAMDDNAAIITVSAFHTNIGEILRATPAAVRMFGFESKTQLIGQNISILVPSPIREQHNNILLNFSGRRQSRVVNRSRLLVGMHRGGYLFPLWLSVMEAPPDPDTCEPRFMANFMEIQTDEDMILFAGADQDFRIYGCSKGLLQLLGLSGEFIQTEKPSMLHWFPSLSPTFHEDDITLSSSQVHALRTMAATGVITGPMLRALGLMSGNGDAITGARSIRHPSARHTGRATTAAASNISLPIHKLMDLEKQQGLLPIADVAIDADVDEDVVAVEGDGGVDEALEESGANSVMAVGQVQSMRFPLLPPFYALTFRTLPRSNEQEFGEKKLRGGRVARSVMLPGEGKDATSIADGGDRGMPPQLLVVRERSHEEEEEEEEDEEDEEEDGGGKTPKVNGKSSEENGKVSDSSETASSSRGSAGKMGLFPSSSDPLKPRSSGGMIEGGEIVVTADDGTDIGAGVSDEGREKAEKSSQPSTSARGGGDAPLRVGFEVQHSGERGGHGMHGTPSHSILHHTHSSAADTRARRNSTDGRASVASTSSTGSTGTQIARMVNASKSFSEPEVVSIRRLFIAISCCFLVVAVLVDQWTRVTWSNVLHSSLGLESAGVRRAALAQAINSLYYLVVVNEGLDEETIGHTKHHHIVTLQHAADVLEETNAELYALGASGGVHAFEFERDFEFFVTHPSTHVTIKTTTLALTERMVGLFNVLAKQGPNVTHTNIDFLATLEYAPTLRKEYGLSMEQRHNDALHTFDEARLQLLIGSGIFFIVAVVATSFLLLRSIRSITSRSSFIMSAFLLVPRTVAKALKGKASFELAQSVAASNASVAGENDETVSITSGWGGPRSISKKVGGNSDAEEAAALVESERREEELTRALGHLRLAAEAYREDQVQNTKEGDDPGGDEGVGDAGEEQKGGGQSAGKVESRREKRKYRDYHDVVRGVKRATTDEGTFVLRQTLSLLTPILVILFFIGTVLLWQSLSSTQVIQDTNRIVVSTRIEAFLEEYQESLVGSMYDPNATRHDLHVHEAKKIATHLLDVSHVALYGGNIHSRHTVAHVEDVSEDDGIVYKILADDACIGTPKVQRDACRTFANSVLEHGAVQGIEAFITVGQHLLDLVLSREHLANSSINHYPADLSPSAAYDLSLIAQGIDPYLRNAMELVREEEHHVVVVEANNTENANVALTWAFFAGFCILGFAFFWRISKGIARPLRAAEHLLTIIPPELVRAHPALHARIQAILSKSGEIRHY